MKIFSSSPLLISLFLLLLQTARSVDKQTCTESKTQKCAKNNGLGFGCDHSGAEGACCAGGCCQGDTGCTTFCCTNLAVSGPDETIDSGPLTPIVSASPDETDLVGTGTASIDVAVDNQVCNNEKAIKCIQENRNGFGCDKDGDEGACCQGRCCDSTCDAWCCDDVAISNPNTPDFTDSANDTATNVISVTIGGSSSASWWDTIRDSYEGDDLKRCRKRSVPPSPGTGCAMRAKTCFFGNQECSSVGPFPDTKCSCDGVKGVAGTWTCGTVSCPPPAPNTVVADDLSDF